MTHIWHGCPYSIWDNCIPKVKYQFHCWPRQVFRHSLGGSRWLWQLEPWTHTETQIEVPVPGLELASSWLMQAFGEQTRRCFSFSRKKKQDSTLPIPTMSIPNDALKQNSGLVTVAEGLSYYNTGETIGGDMGGDTLEPMELYRDR